MAETEGSSARRTIEPRNARAIGGDHRRSGAGRLCPGVVGLVPQYRPGTAKTNRHRADGFQSHDGQFLLRHAGLDRSSAGAGDRRRAILLRRLEAVALQYDGARLSELGQGHAAGDHERSGPGAAQRRSHRIFHAANAGCDLSRQSLDVKSGTIGIDPRAIRAKFGERLSELARGREPDLEARSAGRHGKLQGRRQCGRHAGQGHFPQRTHRAHSIRAHDRHRASRAGADRPGVDHEVLHPGLIAAKFLRALSG